MSAERECRHWGTRLKCAKGLDVKSMMLPGGRIPCFTMYGQVDRSHVCPEHIDVPRTELLGREVAMFQAIDAMLEGRCPRCGTTELERVGHWTLCRPCDVRFHTMPERPEHEGDE